MAILMTDLLFICLIAVVKHDVNSYSFRCNLNRLYNFSFFFMNFFLHYFYLFVICMVSTERQQSIDLMMTLNLQI